MKQVSVIIPVYNEEKEISLCLNSLALQTYQNIQIIVVDDGSTDKTSKIILDCKSKISNLQLLRQNHQGPGSARNLGAAKATGEILVFVDADMTFDKNFIRRLIAPILTGKAIGTFSRDEFVSNYQNTWSACWNINRNLPIDRMLAVNYPDRAPVFRAILKQEFDRVSGFEITGQYTDDWSLSQKLGIKSSNAPGALYYHTNPSTLKEVWNQARWIGKNNFISGNLLRIIKSTIIYNPVTSIVIGLKKSLKHKKFEFLIFKLTYDLGVFYSVIKSLFSEPKFK